MQNSPPRTVDPVFSSRCSIRYGIPMDIGTSVTRTAVAVRQSANDAGTGFLLAEVNAGNAFADVALSARDPEKRRRNTTNARTAYTALLRFRSRVALTEAQASQFQNDLIMLRKKLARLGVST